MVSTIVDLQVPLAPIMQVSIGENLTGDPWRKPDVVDNSSRVTWFTLSLPGGMRLLFHERTLENSAGTEQYHDPPRYTIAGIASFGDPPHIGSPQNLRSTTKHSQREPKPP
jgi:hypothetical protein